MLTQKTQKAIAILHDIDQHLSCAELNYYLPPDSLCSILSRLEQKGLIRLTPGAKAEWTTSYTLCRPLREISLLDVLEAMNEHLNCNHPTTEEFYDRYGKAAQKLGVVNHMTRLYLSEIKLTEC